MGGTHSEVGAADRVVRGSFDNPTHDSDAFGILAVRATRSS
jgi:hypothetical protein